LGAGRGEGLNRLLSDQAVIVTAKKKTVRAVKKKAPSKKSRNGGVMATAAAILGVPLVKGRAKAPSTSIKVKPEWRKFQERLLELREQLLKQRDGLAKDSAQEMASYSLHMADSGTDNFDRDFALSLLSSDQDAIYEIDEALRRMERKSYGVCELTGKAIPKSRLEAIPWTRFTVQAQAQLEREGAMRQRRLGSLGTIESGGMSEPAGDESDADEKSTKDKD
jgi:RNA polymerase-binding transcription factor DksA